MAKALLSDRYVQRHAFAPTDKPIIVRDANEETPWLLLRVGRRTKKLIFQTEVRGKTIYRPLGDWDGESVTVENARKTGGVFRQEIREGKKLASLRDGVTVKAAFDDYIETRAERWGNTVRGFYDRHFASMADRKVASLSSALPGVTKEMVDLHTKITKAGHPIEANRALQTLRAVYRRARQFDKNIPADNPVAAFGALGQWNPEPPAKKAIAFEALAEWGRKVDAIGEKTPIRAAFHRLCVLTGARPEELRELQWATVDWKQRRFTMLNTKGGGGKGKAKKRFPNGLDVTVPMTAVIKRQFEVAKAEGEIMFPDSPFVFPAARGDTGHLMVWKEKTLPKKQHGNFGRHQYSSIGRALGIQRDTMDMLTGHVPPKSDVGANYGQSEHDIEQIKRPAQEIISKKICALLAAKTKAPKKKRAARAA